MPHHTIYLYSYAFVFLLFLLASAWVALCIRADNKIKYEDWERD